MVVSYTRADEPRTTWVAWELEDSGYTTRFQVWDFAAGTHLVTEMHRTAQATAPVPSRCGRPRACSPHVPSRSGGLPTPPIRPSGPGRCRCSGSRTALRRGCLAVTADLFGLDRDSAAARGGGRRLAWSRRRATGPF
ncbi:toll/interleukin-1 receptor domain-containing protein [Frankia gtarii]|uniref:toll/interleukin-1 receptor domain-containing protein n=1 Tax=Frankia gtarii TaxID=2950102 RepID=UPI0034D5DF8A